MNDPKELSNFLVFLSASQVTAKGFELDARIETKKKWLQLKEIPDSTGKRKSDGYVDTEIETTEEFKEWKKIEGQNEVLQEVANAIKKKLSVNIF